MKNKNMAIIGGDRRFSFLCEVLKEEGNNVYRIEKEGVLSEEEISSVKKAEIIILPMPCTGDGKMINGERKVEITKELIKAMEGKLVFAGMAERIPCELCKQMKMHDYGKREEYLILNAQATAEAAFARCVELSPYSLFESSVLILGFGRIGKALTGLFKAAGANVTVCARKHEHFAQIECLGVKKAGYEMLEDRAGENDIIINTVPALVIDEAVIAKLKKDAVIVDLASGSGGTDFSAAKKYGITAEHALSLPGKYSPKSAAEFIFDTIDAICEEAKENERN